jgi:predicted enzyme related to lactoylglutathione lyase
MPRPTHFEIPADNPERAIAFYSSVFGWTFQKWEGPMPYWMIITGPDSEPGINGGLMPKQHPQQPPCNTISVTNLDEMVAKALAAGAELALPKMAVPGVGWLAYCKDTEGHVFGMIQMDAAAK